MNYEQQDLGLFGELYFTVQEDLALNSLNTHTHTHTHTHSHTHGDLCLYFVLCFALRKNVFLSKQFLKLEAG